MHILIDREIRLYDGRQLCSLWAFRTFDLQGDSIVTFRGPCRVEPAHLVDVRDQLDGAAIYSPDMLHFIVEHFDLDLEKAVCRQRLLMAVVRDTLDGVVSPAPRRHGDDLYCGDRKLSVSIATVSPVSTLIHAGLNIYSAGVPVRAAGLADLGLDERRIWTVAQEICRAYAAEIRDIRLARCKVRGVY